MTVTSVNAQTITSLNDEIERLRAYLTAIMDGTGDASSTWIKSMASGALRGDPILIGEAGNYRQIPPEYCETKPCLPESPCQHWHECFAADGEANAR
jgi:hypothetical protein